MTSEVKLESTTEEIELAECPIGLFRSTIGELCLRTEYVAPSGRIDAYIVSSGEFFWGGTSCAADQRKVLVRPVATAAILAMDRRAEVVDDFAPDPADADLIERMDAKDWRGVHSTMFRLTQSQAVRLRAALASPPAPAVAIWQANMENAWAALRMIREAVETFGPITSLDGPDAVLLRGPEPIHEAEAIIEAILRLKPAPAVAVPEGWKLVPIKPSFEMYDAGHKDRHLTPGHIYATMLAAAPEPPATRPETGRDEGIELAAQWHDGEAAFWEKTRGALDGVPDKKVAAHHRSHATAIRSLKGPRDE